MENRNQFKKLRYDTENSWRASISQRELADKMGIGFSTISKLEKEGCDTASVSTIKAYRDYFLKERNEKISYEYLMGEVSTRNEKYHKLGKLFPFDDSFYHNLQQLLVLDKDHHFAEHMLNALLANPEQLFYFLITTFNALYEINTIKKDKELPKEVKNKQIKMQEYVFNQSTIEFLETSVMPLLKYGFDCKDSQLENERIATEQILVDIDSFESSESNMGTNVKVTLAENDKTTK